MKSVITRLEADRDNAGLGEMPYLVEVKGQQVNGMKVVRQQDRTNGKLEVHVRVPRVNGKAVVSVSTQDAIARRVLDGARVKLNALGAMHQHRVYSR